MNEEAISPTPVRDGAAGPRMKAIVGRRYGGPNVLRMEVVETPAPKAGEVRIRVRAASVNAADWRVLRADPFFIRPMTGLLRPKFEIPGADVAGTVEAVGDQVENLRPGDEVFGDLSSNGWGALAEYVCAPEHRWVRKPSNVSFEAAAATPMAGVTALHAVRNEGRVQPGQEVLVHGASGGVGSFAVQLAKHFGAEVTGVCGPSKVEMVHSIGADHVVDYAREDVTRSTRHYDVIVDAAAYRSIFDYRRVLKFDGRYVLVGGGLSSLFQAMVLGPWVSRFSKKKMSSVLSMPNQEDLQLLAGLLESGEVVPYIDRRFALDEAPAAFRHVEGRKVRGKVVVTV